MHKKFSQLISDSELLVKFWPTQGPARLFHKISYKSSLHILYTQSFQTTFALPVLPRLLAQTYSANTVIIFFAKRGLQRYCCPLLTLGLSMGQAGAHCPKFLTAALRGGLNLLSVSMWLNIFQYQLKITSLAGHYP